VHPMNSFKMESATATDMPIRIVSQRLQQVCVRRSRISESGLRFTLSWVGHEEQYLSVMTPAWQTLNSAITVAKDALSGALWEYTDDATGVHTRNLFFLEDVPVGKYTCSVGSRGLSSGIMWKWNFMPMAPKIIPRWCRTNSLFFFEHSRNLKIHQTAHLRRRRQL
jgi:hypothetical protein